MFLRKNSGNKRVLLNEMKVADFLSQKGFNIIDTEHMTAKDVIQHILEASIVIGVEGSQINPAIYGLRESGTILALQPPDRFSTAHKEFTDCLGLRYGFLVGDPGLGGFTIEFNSLAQLLDKIIR
jgi:capsular polysaccharide biosynthesis protein